MDCHAKKEILISQIHGNMKSFLKQNTVRKLGELAPSIATSKLNRLKSLNRNIINDEDKGDDLFNSQSSSDHHVNLGG